LPEFYLNKKHLCNHFSFASTGKLSMEWQAKTFILEMSLLPYIFVQTLISNYFFEHSIKNIDSYLEKHPFWK